MSNPGRRQQRHAYRRILAAALLGGLLACGDDVARIGRLGEQDGAVVDASRDAALLPACEGRPIAFLFVATGPLLEIGQTVKVEAALTAEATAAAQRLSWWLHNDESHTARGNLVSVADCSPGFAGCARFTCTGMGGNTTFDPASGMMVAGVWVTAKHEAPSCFSTAHMLVRCTDGTAVDAGPGEPGPDAGAPGDGGL